MNCYNNRPCAKNRYRPEHCDRCMKEQIVSGNYTNAERIRDMPDEKLASFLASVTNTEQSTARWREWLNDSARKEKVNADPKQLYAEPNTHKGRQTVTKGNYQRNYKKGGGQPV